MAIRGKTMLIKTPSRLHMSLIDLNSSYGRIDGGIGLALKEPNIIIESEEIENGILVEFPENIENKELILEYTEKIESAAKQILSFFNSNKGFKFTVHSVYLNHSGLGSGTQIKLATAKLISESLGKSLTSVELSTIVGRGGTSGIGTFCFEHGGFIVDGGHSLKEKNDYLPSSASSAKPPKLIGRYDFPEEWDILVAVPNVDYSVKGAKEKDIFQKYCPVPRMDVERLSHIIFMNMVPFLLEKDIIGFSKCVEEVQKLGFKKIEVKLQPDTTTNLMQFMRDSGAYGVGMSSFGPAIYTIYDKNNKDIVKATKEYLPSDATIFTTKAQNHGYELLDK